MAPNVTVHFWAAADILGAPILEITDEDEFFRGFKLTPDLFSLGGWELTLARRVGFALFDSGAVQPEVFVRFLVHAYSDTDYYFGGSLQKREQKVVDRQEDGEEIFIFGGPGPKSYMDRYRLGIEQLTGTGWNLDLDNGVWRWNETATAGRVLNRVVAEDAAQADPSLPDLTKTFGDVNDSDGNPWTNDVAGAGEFEIPIGNSLLQVIFDLEDLSELYTVVNLGSVGAPLYQLEAFEAYGTDVTGSSFGAGVGLIREGVNIANDSLTVEGVGIRKATHVIVEGKDGAWTTAVGTAWSPGEYIKWGKIEYPRSSNVNILERAGLRWIRRQDNGDKQITVEIVPGASEATGYYFPGPGEVLWPGNTVTLDTAEDGTTHTPLDFNNEDELLTGLDLTLGPAGDTATADKQAKSWDIKLRLNWERAGFAGAPDQTSAATGNNPCKCPPLCHPGTPGDEPDFVDADVDFENDNLLDLHYAITGGADHAVYVPVISQGTVTEVRWYASGISGSFQSFEKLGEIVDVVNAGVTQRLSVWRLLDPDATVSSPVLRAIKSNSLAGMIGAMELEGVNQDDPDGGVTLGEGTGTAATLAGDAASGQVVLKIAGWMFQNATGISDPTEGGGLTEAFSDSFNNSAGRADAALAGGYGSGSSTWSFGANRAFVSAIIAVNGIGGVPGGEPQDIGLVGSIGSSANAARCDHVHAHGNLSPTGDAMHSLAQISNDPASNDLDPNAQVAFDELAALVAGIDPGDSGFSVPVVVGALSNPPTQAEIQALAGSPATLTPIQILQDTGTEKRYVVVSDGVQWHFIPYVIPTQQTGVAALTSVPNGGWAGTTHAAFQYNGNTYIAYVRGDNGNVELRSTAAIGTPEVLHAALNTDLHSAPSTTKLPDGRIIAFYSDHAGSQLYQWISTNPEDISSGTETNIDAQLGGTGYTYPMVADLASGLYLFVRHSGGAAAGQQWGFSVSTDDGVTWSALEDFYVVAGKTAYPLAMKTGPDRVDFIAINGSTLESNNDIQHFYLDGSDGTWHGTDGTALTLPVASQAETLVWDGATSDDAYGRFDVQLGTDGHPRLLFATISGTTETFRHGRWTGSAWVFTALLSGTAVDGDSAQFDSLNTNILALSDASHEIRILETTDEITWASETVTVATTSIYPISPIDHAPDLPFIWLTGSFTSSAVYSLGITGYGASDAAASADNLQRVVAMVGDQADIETDAGSLAEIEVGFADDTELMGMRRNGVWFFAGGGSGGIWRPVMAFDPVDSHWYVVVDGDGTAVMAEG